LPKNNICPFGQQKSLLCVADEDVNSAQVTKNNVVCIYDINLLTANEFTIQKKQL